MSTIKEIHEMKEVVAFHYYGLQFRDLRKANRQPWQKHLDELYNRALRKTSNFHQGRNNALGRNNRYQQPVRPSFSRDKFALPTIGKSIVRYPHAHKDTYVRSVEAPTHYQAALVKQPVLKNNFSKLPNLPSPVKSNVLNKELFGYDSVLRKHLVSRFQYGFRLGSLGEAPSLICKNHKSATDNPVKVFEKLAK